MPSIPIYCSFLYMYRLIYTIIVLLFLSHPLLAQTAKNTALVVGRIQVKNTHQSLVDVQVSIPKLKITTNTGSQGEFALSEVPFGAHRVFITGSSIQTDSVMILVNKDIDMGTISVQILKNTPPSVTPEIPTISIEDNNIGTDDDVQVQNADGIAGSTSDPFWSNATFIFNIANHWYPRGYVHSEQEVRVNGIPMNEVSSTSSVWNQWAGLNDVFHTRDVVHGLAPSDYTFGKLIGSANINATAIDQRKEDQVTYSIADRNYRNTIELTHNSGLMKNGWAYSISVSKRWAEEGYVPGTFYNGYGYYASATKVVKKHEFSFTTFGAPTSRGMSSSVTKEEASLSGTNYYNPDWGYQQGVKRNARVNSEFQPVFMLTHKYKPSSSTIWTTSLAYQFGKDKQQKFDWYNSSDPYPNYYKYLPSWQLNMAQPNPQAAAQLTNAILADRNLLQVDWDKIYHNNYLDFDSVQNANGIAGNTVKGRQSLVVLANDVQDMKKWTFNTNLQHSVNEHITLYTGLEILAQKTESYRQLADLLGGDYFVNYNQFAAQQYIGNSSYIQNNLNYPNQVIRVGDKYGYDYINNYLNGTYRAQIKFNYNRFDMFMSGFAGLNTFNRDGLMRNGLFPNNSYGTSPTESFLVYGIKGGIDYKIDRFNTLYVNVGYRADPPSVDNTYISARTRDFTVDNPAVQYTSSVEGGYVINTPKVLGRATFYATEITGATMIKRFYNDDPAYETFVNYVMQDVNMQFTGTELALEYKMLPQFSITGIASVGQAFYANRPTVSQYLDNDTVKSGHPSQSYIKNYYLASGPQSAYSLGFNYHKTRKWNTRINFSYFDRNYVDVNPARRTIQAAGALTPGSADWKAVFDQEKLPAYFVVDLSGGYDFNLSGKNKMLPHGTVLTLKGSINNLLNNTNIIYRGSEQLRYDFTNNNPNTFPTKYLYGEGINFIFTAVLKF